MATIMAMPRSMNSEKAKSPFSACTLPNWAGILLTTLAKIRIDIPLPIPRWVMSSPIHMTMAVPAVIVSTMSDTWGRSNLVTSLRLVSVPRPRRPLLNW